MKLFTRTADRPETRAAMLRHLADAQAATRQAQRERDRALQLLQDLVNAVHTIPANTPVELPGRDVAFVRAPHLDRADLQGAQAAARRHLARGGRL